MKEAASVVTARVGVDIVLRGPLQRPSAHEDLLEPGNPNLGAVG